MTQFNLYNQSFKQIAINRLIEYEPDAGYYLAFSGGKDSIVIYSLAEEAGVKFDAHFSMTTLDPPEVTDFIKSYYPKVIWERPKKSFLQIIVEHKMLPTRNIRYCCRELKEIGGRGRTVITGIRRAESVSRRGRLEFEESTRVKGKFFVNPIIDWYSNDVWDYIHQKNLKYCCLYDMGKKRIGCLFCPMQGQKGMEWDKEHYPKYYKALLRAIQRMLDKCAEDGTPWRKGNTPEDVWKWWITRTAF